MQAISQTELANKIRDEYFMSEEQKSDEQLKIVHFKISCLLGV